ncbi:hypothetical protein GDO78_018663 [Eleutherodactylus coqui]|uniref:MADF domain-containing protein n=1 Tax=Eleutherodactylus coqui TaxID=57060 RepID=A0A8J6BEE6_ELECQ|nr:hypothetical protein GDO78_018663 [Eleutherodactylus coqui]
MLTFSYCSQDYLHFLLSPSAFRLQRQPTFRKMSWYQRMGINVVRMITLIESRPEIWDPAEPGYSDRDIKADAWIAVCSGMYPDWDSATAAIQSEILKDIKNRWQSVRDRYKKHEKECEKSGISSGNITAAPPTVETATADTEGPEQESRDDDIREGTPILEDSQWSTPDLCPTSVTPEVGEQNVSRSSSAGPSSRAGSSPEVSSERTSRSVAARPRRKNKPDAAQEVLTLLRRADTEDQWDTMFVN